MRPSGAIRQAVLQAACKLAEGRGCGATLAEIAAHVRPHGVAPASVRYTVQNLARSGALRSVGQRRVEYRNRPVAEYAPAMQQHEDIFSAANAVQALADCLTAWR